MPMPAYVKIEAYSSFNLVTCEVLASVKPEGYQTLQFEQGLK